MKLLSFYHSILMLSYTTLVPRPPRTRNVPRNKNFPRLAIFIACYVARVGEGLGTRLELHHVICSIHIITP